jgi:hypothetical protein
MRRMEQQFAAGGYSRKVRPSRLVPVAVCWVALTLPPSAAAHLRIATVAVGSTVQVAALAPALRPAVVVQVRARDRSIEVTAKHGYVVVVLGYLGEPFLRLSARGVSVDASSPTAVAVGLVGQHARGDGWHLVHAGVASAAWRDVRLQGAPHPGHAVAWSIPLLVDGRRVSVRGSVRALPRPSPWPWAAIALLSAAALLAARRTWRGSAAAVVAGATAAAAALAVCGAFAVGPSASPGLRIESVDETVIVLAGVGILLRGGAQVRAAAACGTGLVALAAAATKGQVFVEGAVLAAVPGAAARVFVSLALGAGLAAVVLGGACLRERRETSPRPDAVRLPTRWE